MTAAVPSPKVELEFRCEACGQQWRCWYTLASDTEASAMTHARTNGWMRCTKCQAEPARRVA